mgnify:CR=1 FL=1
MDVASGTHYELCWETCGSKHAEVEALRHASEDVSDADLYLWGHWWCCKDCWDAMIEKKIHNVYIAKNAHESK